MCTIAFINAPSLLLDSSGMVGADVEQGSLRSVWRMEMELAWAGQSPIQRSGIRLATEGIPQWFPLVCRSWDEFNMALVKYDKSSFQMFKRRRPKSVASRNRQMQERFDLVMRSFSSSVKYYILLCRWNSKSQASDWETASQGCSIN